MSTSNDAEFVADLTAKLLTALKDVDRHGRDVIARIQDAMNGHPKAAAWDTTRTAGRLWCWRHQQDLSRCHLDGHICAGEALDGPSDPTGEAAIVPDIAATDLRNLINAYRRMRNDADLAWRIVTAYPGPHPASAYDQSITVDWNLPHCENHKLIEITKGVPWWVESETKERTTAKDRLPKAMWLCRWCRDHVDSTEDLEGMGILPSLDELEQHRAGKKIRCPHPRIEREDAA